MVKITSIGILGGTFNPIHMGHLIIAQEVMQKASLDKVIFIPSGIPPHKDSKKVLEPSHRLNMVLGATKDNPRFETSSIEIERAGVSYAIDTLRQLKELYKEDVLLYYIVGADNVFEIEAWKSCKALLNICNILVATRPGVDRKKLIEVANRLTVEYGANISIYDVPLIEISSSDVRNRVNNNITIKYLVHESVEEYIYEYGLYK